MACSAAFNFARSSRSRVSSRSIAASDSPSLRICRTRPACSTTSAAKKRRAAVRRFLAADVVEQVGLVRQMRSDGESAAAIEREETLLRELRAKLKAAEQAIADAKR